VSERAEGVEFFPVGTDPRSYVRTAAAEEALDAIQGELRRARAPVVLIGIPGVGKTLLLRVLEQRLAESFRVVYLPFTALPADELCTWVLGLLGENAGPEPERDLLAASSRLEGSGSPLIVILDDVGSMPVATARRLSALLAESDGSLRVALALAEGSRSERILTSFKPAPVRIELRELMSADETGRYLRAHLVRSNAPQEVRARFDPISIRDLHRGSGGVPRVLNGLAGELARGNLAVLPRQETEERREPLGRALELFEVTSDPTAYVPRSATQELLASAESALRKGARSILVTGPPGLGKTLLLRVLERRLRSGYKPVAISYTALLPDQLCRWILNLLGEPVTEYPKAALLELARRLSASKRDLVLLLDDAGSIPTATVQHLAELADATNRAVRLVLFAVEDGRVAGLLGALGSDAVTLHFREPMSEAETIEYIYARLARARAPTGLVECFDPGTVARLHAESEGIPRELHRLAAEVAREGESEIAAQVPTPDLPEASVPSESPPPRAPPAPSPARARAPKRAPTTPRFPISGRAAVYGLLVLAILLAAIPLFRGGFPWVLDLPTAGPEAAPPAAVQSPETPAPPASEEPVETIAVNINAAPWASIEVDGEHLGETPLANVPLSPGSHVFRARMADGEIREHRVEVGPTMRHVVFSAKPAPEEIEPAPERTAAPAPPPPVREEPVEVALDADPYLERALPEITPEVEQALPETAPEIAPAPQEETPDVAIAPERVASAPEPEPVPAAPPPEPISVSINATPWATIEIDGEEIGVTPMAGVLLAPGNHQFRVTLPDGRVLEETVRITRGNRHIAFAE
jgi:type II secretory pathway predicted ATPase ExeA